MDTVYKRDKLLRDIKNTKAVCDTWFSPEGAVLLTLCFRKNDYDIYFEDKLVSDFHGFRAQLSKDFHKVMTELLENKMIVVEYVSFDWGLSTFGVKFIYVKNESFEYNRNITRLLMLHPTTLPLSFTISRTLVAANSFITTACSRKDESWRILVRRFDEFDTEIDLKIYEFNSLFRVKTELSDVELCQLRETVIECIDKNFRLCTGSRRQLYTLLSLIVISYEDKYGFITHKKHYRKTAKFFLRQEFYFKRLTFSKKWKTK